ncbi:uncharacterized protein B4U80_01911 [Leptotrombidium deliense]|uniref:Sulfatase N-terminal domain-containing protein n=1 Tax=Leptotrombidium deliense TaxID=299467 RepID=A0A443SE51_9ACAR|nr:uncharacterized protein B4U80_01911 [Leptotrombidium deliense]
MSDTIKADLNNQDTVGHENTSVFILVIESLSRLNYLRSLNRTRSEFESLGNYFYMKGLTKLADNSFPNMVPFLTGIRAKSKEFPAKVKETEGPYDEMPFIWKLFQANGYKTAFIEDHPRFTLFNYLAKGFVHRPVDWYPRPFWIQIEREAGLRSHSFCYNGVPKIDIFLQQLNLFLKKVKSNPFFVYSFYIQVSHEDFNKAHMLDSHISKFINEHRQQLNTSIFILMGDHGNRYGNILESDIGRIEERMPLFAMHLPERLLKKHNHLKTYLNINSRRLTTWLDVHRTLQDVVHSNYTPISTLENRSYSLWRQEVPKNRTCEQALVPENFCVCDERKEISTSDPHVKKAAIVLVNKINDVLSKEKSKCHFLKLYKIKSSFVVLAWKPDGDNITRFEIVISVKPSNAVFRAQVVEANKKMKQDGDISRINQYGSQSACVQNERE